MTSRHIIFLIWSLFCWQLASAEDVRSDQEISQLTETHPTERVVFVTSYGDLVFALYPNLAPHHVKHFKKLVELHLYENVYVARVIQDFVFQFSEIHKKPGQISDQQKAELHTIKAEFSHDVKHVRGRLSMAHQNGEPDSATNSFSILLGDASHLDGKYTIFGELESGWNVINKVLATSINGVTPSRKVYVRKAMIVSDVIEYYKTHPRDTDTYIAPKPKKQRKTVDTKKRRIKTSQDLLKAIAVLVAVNILIALLGVLLYEKWKKIHLRSLMTLMILVSGFTLLILLLSIETDYAWIGIVFFLVLVGMLRIMSRFEN